MTEPMPPRDDERRKFEAWTVEQTGEERILCVWYEVNGVRLKREVAALCSWNGLDDQTRDEAFLLNAVRRAEQAETPRVAEAHDLLEALEHIVEELEAHDLGGECWIRAKAAIARAEARPPNDSIAEISRSYVQTAAVSAKTPVGYISVENCPGPSCTVCGATMQPKVEFKCPSCGSTPAPTEPSQARVAAQWPTFDTWWTRDGKFFDPDTDDVPWFDKRKDLAEYAFSRARQVTEAAAPVEDRPAPTPYMHEDEVPAMPREDYEAWYANSYILGGSAGVRVGPIYPAPEKE